MGSYNGYGYVPKKTYSLEQEARYKKLSQREYGQKEVPKMHRDIDKRFVALPAGWRKSASGRWYFENRKNRTDNRDERYEAYNSSMPKEQRAKAYKHIHVDSKVVLGLGGQPEYARYVVRYGNFIGAGQDKVKAVREYKKGVAHTISRRKVHAGSHTPSALTYRKVMGGKPLASTERRYTSTDAFLQPYAPKYENLVKIPSARKTNARKNASLAAYGVDAEVAKAVKKITAKKATAKKTTAKKTTAKKSTAKKPAAKKTAKKTAKK